MTESDALPHVRIMANRLRLSLRDHDLPHLINAHVALQTGDANRCLTMIFGDGGIKLANNISDDADLVYTTNLNNLHSPVRSKGNWRNPLLARQVDKLLSQPLPEWDDCAKAFWTRASEIPELPVGLSVTCINDGRSLVLGDTSTTVELHGTRNALQIALIGASPIAIMVAANQLQFRGSLRDLAYLSNLGQRIMLGEPHG